MITRLPVILVIANLASGLVLHARAQDSRAEQTVPIKIYFDQKIKMRDGIALAADLYQPDRPGRFPCILNRTPYLKSSAGTAEFGEYFAEHGYAFVAVDVRGRGDSEGLFVPYRNEGRDGYDRRILQWKESMARRATTASDHHDRYGEPFGSIRGVSAGRTDSA